MKKSFAFAVLATAFAGPVLAGPGTELGDVATASTTFMSGIAISSQSGLATSATGDRAVAIGDSTTANGLSATAIGGQATAAGNSATAIGDRASVTADGGTALGQQATVTAAGGTSLGAGANTAGTNSVAIGSSATVTAGASNAVAIGSFSKATASDTVAVGDPSVNYTRRIVGVSAGVASTDAVNKAQLDAVAAAAGTDATARAAAATAQTGVNNIINGTTDLSNATVGGVTLATIATAGTTDNVARATANQALTQSQQTQAALDDFATKTDNRFRAIDTRLGDMTREYRAGIAASMAGTHAVSAAVQGNSLGVGVGTFGGQAAVSLGLATQLKRGTLTASLSAAGGKTGGGVGFTLPIF